MQQFDLEIEGMTCAGCGDHVADALRGVEGVETVRMGDWTEGRASVTTKRGVDPEALTAAVADTGYTAHVEIVRSSSTPISPDDGAEADYDLVVVGGGSAAFAAALKASELGRRAVIINDGPGAGGLPVGGTCVNVGCVPSKALIRAAEAHRTAANHPFDGITSESEVTDFGAVTDQVQALVDDLQQKKYLDVVAKDPNVTIREGRARLVGERAVEVGGETVTGRRILIATGARSFVPDIPGLEETGYLTNEELYRLDEQPEHLIVLGGGYIALENAQAFARLGSEVTVLQRSGQILSREDDDVAEALTGYLREEGLTVHTNTDVQAAGRANGTIQIEVEIDDTPQTITGTDVLVATGLRANTDALGLEDLSIDTHGRGFLAVDDTLQTAVPSVYGAGDVIGDPAFVYAAAREGQLAAENALEGTAHDRRAMPLPWVIFTDPQVAGVGVGEREAAEQGVEVDVATLPLDQVPRALAARDTRGFIKLLRERDSDRLVGARIVASEGSELLMELSVAIQQGLTVEDLTDLLHPYLTMSEGVKLAALGFDRDVSTLSCCAT
ncbi:mercuric reductase [Salinibacter ruber]|jgi:mercuric reductase|uniref:Mercuric reductase n=1 Tax=Salinibacter ruber TaxID=146919 RepID=A0A9X2QRL9_9BACT|nr:mercury(II) reductase [Salinibacter ruber]MCS3635715.1 mercuric reductase [Salinibacter ruber]MCS3638763.1 mercuric reductase [Salinibacter ruber]MCS3660014.1 mercuric reductase [Salinibacter ruber]MCS3709699.1 mercuric reductase [Salinibacter ruber]MCS3715194.1 mercuric reductase [Salinibacter ruber]